VYDRIVDRTERFYRIERMLRSQRIVPVAALLAQLEVSPATLKRDLEYMRSRLQAPIEFDRAAGGYRLADTAGASGRYELPGMWFSPAEIHALLTLQHLIANLRTGSLIGPHLEAVTQRMRAALGSGADNADEVGRRVRILGMATRDIPLEHFELVGSALLRRRRLHVTYFGRGRGEVSERDVSPQRLVHYRDNWYLDAYCHVREDLRSFALDAVESVRLLDEAAIEITDAALDVRLGSGYGIFSGEDVTWARLKFTPERARWVAAEAWHPKQRSRIDPDGSYVLELPYSDPRELIMDVLRHGADVEVLAPAALRDEVKRTIDAMQARYTPDGSR
jgi:predicted DNA-binding transcriptional regulator YafY